SFAYFSLDYDQRTALNQSGSLVPGIVSSYHYTQFRLALQMAPGRRWNARVGVTNLERVDEYNGYFDFTSKAGFASLEFRPDRRSTLSLSATASSLEYDRATVASTSSGDLRGSDLLNFTGRFERRFREHLSFFLEQGVQTSDNPDPIFAYNRNWTAAGVRIRQ
ncbi:MAG: hypothetical protein ACE5ID_12865, partial [Acidobacteriota bacterium]